MLPVILLNLVRCCSDPFEVRFCYIRDHFLQDSIEIFQKLSIIYQIHVQNLDYLYKNHISLISMLRPGFEPGICDSKGRNAWPDCAAFIATTPPELQFEYFIDIIKSFLFVISTIKFLFSSIHWKVELFVNNQFFPC